MSPHQLQARDLLLSIDRGRRITLARQIEDQLRDACRSGLLASGTGLPSTRTLAEDLGVSRGVVSRAYEQLAAEGYIDLRQGANPTVRETRAPARSPAPSSPKCQFDLRPHLPDLSSFPRNAWLRAQARALMAAPAQELGYLDSRGLEGLRVELAAYLGRARGVFADADQIVVTAGTTHALSMIARALLRDGIREMGFENPSHSLQHLVAQRAGLQPVGLPLDGHGLVVDGLVDSDLHVVVVGPAHQFPTGVAMSSERRKALVAWAKATDALIVEDEYDAEFRYDKQPIAALHALAPKQTIHLGSTSKTLAPGLRLGWAVLPHHLVGAVTMELGTSLLHTSGFEQLAFADFLSRGEFDRHLRKMRRLYRQRRDTLVGTLRAALPDLPIRGISAGLHLVLEITEPGLAVEARDVARARGFAIDAISDHVLPGYDGADGLLVGYGAIAEPAIPEAVTALARAYALARR
jgi:GntR family transcriptional regulator/MocR family aminotransferase